MPGEEARSRRHTSTPSRSGRPRSSRAMSNVRPAAASRPLRPLRCHDTAWPCARSPLVRAAPIVSSSSTTRRSAMVADRRERTCAQPVRRLPVVRLPSASLRRTGRWPAGAEPGAVRTRARTSRVLIVSGSVGAGHDGAAYELAARLRRAGVEVAVRDYLDAVPRPVSRVLREGYLATVERVPAFFEAFFRGLERQGPLWRAEQRL